MATGGGARGLCAGLGGELGTDGAVATADPCVNRALGVF
jgi:hypothetical protein